MNTKTQALTVEMVFSKSTKGMHVYAALDAGAAAATTIYVQKSALGATPPKGTSRMAAIRQCSASSTSRRGGTASGWSPRNW